MTDAMEVLFQYAQEHIIRPLLDKDPEFDQVLSCLERQESSFRTLLDDDMSRRFEKLVSEQALFDFIHERAAFRAGFQIAMELHAP